MPRRKLRLPNEYTPIRSLLQITIEDGVIAPDSYVRIMVSDAIQMHDDHQHRFHANSRVYRYSSYLSEHSMHVIERMEPERLSINDCRTLLEIFESL